MDDVRASLLPAGPLPGTAATSLALADLMDTAAAATEQADLLTRAAARQSGTIGHAHAERARHGFKAIAEAAAALSAAGTPERTARLWTDYLRDRLERLVLTLDALRQRGDDFLAHEAAGCPPVLVYGTELALDGARLPQPCNYMLLRILPPEGVAIDPRQRPYVIIDPRAGHGAGIGGFKTDSQVGVALAAGHPVYFVAFRRDPIPGQTLADVTRAEAEFVREVTRRHPDAPKPVVIGNCQGGWATLVLAATNPDLTGPIVLNGAPVAAWSGEVGNNPMRYTAGVAGGAWVPMWLADLGGGVFDGAHLVMNFETQNPSRNYFRKYYDLFTKIDSERDRFLEFERWWGGFFLLNEPEIRWIVQEIFVGNRLTRNMAQLEPGRPVDVKAIRAPVIVFASHGDNITPPRQALDWIVESYADVQEIRIRGQRIIYMVHEEVGHLGIFVSAKIARKEHAEVASVMETIEALAPGLYEMRILDAAGDGGRRRFTVSFEERSLSDLRPAGVNTAEQRAFGAVARLSDVQSEAYDSFVRPMLRAMVPPPLADFARAMHPLRVQRALLSGRNPLLASIPPLAQRVRDGRNPIAAENPFAAMETAFADMLEQVMDIQRDLLDMTKELAFFGLWASPAAQHFGRARATGRTLKNMAELHGLPEAQMALARVSEGGFVEAVIRMLIMLAESRGGVRRDRLERSAQVLTSDQPFAALSADDRTRIIREQTLIATLAPERAMATLPDLLATPQDRERALRVVRYVPGRVDEMAPHTFETLRRMAEILGLPPFTEDILEDPLAAPAPRAEAAPASASPAKPQRTRSRTTEETDA